MTIEKLNTLSTRQLKRIVHDGQFTDEILEAAQEVIDARGYGELGSTFADATYVEFETDLVAVASSNANYVLAETE